jgi:hypothetical protein
MLKARVRRGRVRSRSKQGSIGEPKHTLEQALTVARAAAKKRQTKPFRGLGDSYGLRSRDANGASSK